MQIIFKTTLWCDYNKMKNIVICCDGTGNDFGDKKSNVVKLFSVYG